MDDALKHQSTYTAHAITGGVNHLGNTFNIYHHSEASPTPSPQTKPPETIARWEVKLRDAAQRGDTQKLEFLCKSAAGADIDSKSEDGLTAVHCAASAGQVESLKVLVKHKADLNRNTYKGTSLHLAILQGRRNVVDFLLDQPSVNINAQAPSGQTPLSVACRSAMLALLLNHGADPNIALKSGLTPLHRAAVRLNLENVEPLLKAGALPNALSSSGTTALWYACRYVQAQSIQDCANILEILFQYGAEQRPGSDKNVSGLYPLHLIATLGYSQLVEMLLRNGGAVDVLSKDHETPLTLAIKGSKAAMVSVLLKSNASVNLRCGGRDTPFHHSAGGSSNEVFELLMAEVKILDIKNEPNTPQVDQVLDEHSNTPLHWVKTLPQAVKALVQRDPGFLAHKNTEGSTPLHVAVCTSTLAVVKALVDQGAPLNAKNHNNVSPVEELCRRQEVWKEATNDKKRQEALFQIMEATLTWSKTFPRQLEGCRRELNGWFKTEDWDGKRAVKGQVDDKLRSIDKKEAMQMGVMFATNLINRANLRLLNRLILRTGLSKDAFVGLGYSTLTLLVLLIATIILPIIPTLIAQRKVKTSVPLAGGSSMVMSAACHVPILDGSITSSSQKGDSQNAMQHQSMPMREADSICETYNGPEPIEMQELLAPTEVSGSDIQADTSYSEGVPVPDAKSYLVEVAQNPIRWGVVKTPASWNEQYTDASITVGHLSFGTERHNVQEPIPGQWYA
ncbi:hypothetical protein FDECE_375 [Fusarium decemcellulare]|nr:hypothetical protein FDECE_375 [Fusarium decemcellulare]